MGLIPVKPPPEFEIKDSGEREQFDSGMVRDTEEEKLDYTLIFDGPMLDRWAKHLTKGAKKYAARNWMQADSEEELSRFQRSFLRHMRAWLRGETDEDHAAAMIFNINGVEYVLDQLWERGVADLVSDTDWDKRFNDLSLPSVFPSDGPTVEYAPAPCVCGVNYPHAHVPTAMDPGFDPGQVIPQRTMPAVLGRDRHLPNGVPKEVPPMPRELG